MKHKFSINRLTLAFASLLLCAVFLFSCMQQKERKIILSEDDLLILTERAFIEGYKAALLKQHEDTVWVKLSDEYREFFK
jgi:hypothetical protein